MRRLLLIFILFLFVSGCSAATPEIKDTGQPGSIKIFVFLDANHNGIVDPGEEGLQTQVFITQQLSCPPTDVTKLIKQPTGPDGLTTFKNLKAGRYCVGQFGNYAMTTRAVVEVFLSSDQEAQTAFGLGEKP
jgi:hypothetical protein